VPLGKARATRPRPRYALQVDNREAEE